MEECKGCYYNTDTECLILKERQKNYSSKADREEAERREEAIKEYKSIAMPVKCEPVREKLKKHFMKLYQSGYNDTEISEILKISQSSVNDYRRKLGLKTQRERKKEPATTGERKIN